MYDFDTLPKGWYCCDICHKPECMRTFWIRLELQHLPQWKPDNYAALSCNAWHGWKKPKPTWEQTSLF